MCGARSLLEHNSRAPRNQACEFAGIPIREPNATVRLGIADLCRIRRAVDPVMGVADSNPYNAHWIVWARCDGRLGTGGIGIPKQVGVVIVRWISPHFSDLPISEGERSMHAAAGHRSEENNPPFPVIHFQDRCLLRDNHLDHSCAEPLGVQSLSWGTHHVGHSDLLARKETCPGVQAPEQGWSRVEFCA